MDKFKCKPLSPITGNKMFLVDKDVWKAVVDYLNAQTEAINGLITALDNHISDNNLKVSKICDDLKTATNNIVDLSKIVKERIINA